MSKTAIEHMLDLQKQAIDGSMGRVVQIIAEQGVIASNSTIAKLIEMDAIENQKMTSLEATLLHKQNHLEMAKLEVEMCQLMIDTLKATNAALQAAQQCGTSSTDSSSQNSPAEGKES